MKYLIALPLIGIACAFMQVTEADIKACEESTGWTYERCSQELAR